MGPARLVGRPRSGGAWQNVTDKESVFSLSVPCLDVDRRQVPQHVLYFRNHLRVFGVLSALLQARAFGKLLVSLKLLFEA
jgi:hypothetical protein